jgi:hypothetical protein
MSDHKKAIESTREDFYSAGPVNDTAAYTFEGLLEYVNSLHADNERLRAELEEARRIAEELHGLWSRVAIPGADVEPLPWRADNA